MSFASLNSFFPPLTLLQGFIRAIRVSNRDITQQVSEALNGSEEETKQRADSEFEHMFDQSDSDILFLVQVLLDGFDFLCRDKQSPWSLKSLREQTSASV